jgi:aspartyl-tRNA(Asn)/glutamyl-tRNA(Gln) amidotransferase subunit B
LADFFEACVKDFPQPKTVSNWVMGSILATLKVQNKTIEETPVSPRRLAELLRLIDSGVISGKIAKGVYDEMVSSGKPAETIVQEQGLVQVTDADAITEVVQQVLDDHQKEVAEYQGGKTKLFGFFVGQVMKATRGKANPKMVNEILKKKLEG